MSDKRTQKIADRIKVLVAELLERRIKDPRLGFVTVTDVRVTGDNQHASIFYTVLGDAEAIEGTQQALESATGHLRSEVGKQLGLRHTPSLTFHLDAVPESAAQIEDLLARARAKDAEVASQSLGASYAGDENPYRSHEDDEDDEDDPAT